MKKNIEIINLVPLKVGLLATLLMLLLTHKLPADIIGGIVVGKNPQEFKTALLIKVDQKGLRPYDHVIWLEDTKWPNTPGSILNMMIEPGVYIEFEDERLNDSSGTPSGDQNRIMSVNGNYILDIFPDIRREFTWAEWHKKNGTPYVPRGRERD